MYGMICDMVFVLGEVYQIYFFCFTFSTHRMNPFFFLKAIDYLLKNWGIFFFYKRMKIKWFILPITIKGLLLKTCGNGSFRAVAPNVNLVGPKLKFLLNLVIFWPMVVFKRLEKPGALVHWDATALRFLNFLYCHQWKKKKRAWILFKFTKTTILKIKWIICKLTIGRRKVLGLRCN